MPNWCYTTMEITGSPKQIEKIYKKLKNKDKDTVYDNINLDIDYGLLGYLDTINIAINNDSYLYQQLDDKCKIGIECSIEDYSLAPIRHQIKDGYTTVYGIEGLLRIMYNNIGHFSNSGTNIYFFKTNGGYQAMLDHLISVATKAFSSYDKADYSFSNITPDNPMTMYRNADLFKVNPLIDDANKDKPQFLLRRSDGFKCDPNLISWYDSRINRLSTKWFPNINICEITCPGTLTISMECAWGPCTNIAIYLTDIYDIRIDMSYSEGGMAFVGGDIIEDGVVENYFEGNASTGLEFCRMEDELFGGGELFDDSFPDYVSDDMDKDWDDISRSELKQHLEDEEPWLGDEIDDMVNKFKPIRKIKIKKKK